MLFSGPLTISKCEAIWDSVVFTLQPRNMGQKSYHLPVCLKAKRSEDVLSAHSGFSHCCLECTIALVCLQNKARRHFALIMEKVTRGWVIHSSCICVSLLMQAEKTIAAAACTCLSPACCWGLQQQVQEREVEGRWHEHVEAKGWRKGLLGREILANCLPLELLYIQTSLFFLIFQQIKISKDDSSHSSCFLVNVWWKGMKRCIVFKIWGNIFFQKYCLGEMKQ